MGSRELQAVSCYCCAKLQRADKQQDSLRLSLSLLLIPQLVDLNTLSFFWLILFIKKKNQIKIFSWSQRESALTMYWNRRMKVGQWVSSGNGLSLASLWVKPEPCYSHSAIQLPLRWPNLYAVGVTNIVFCCCFFKIWTSFVQGSYVFEYDLFTIACTTLNFIRQKWQSWFENLLWLSTVALVLSAWTHSGIKLRLWGFTQGSIFKLQNVKVYKVYSLNTCSRSRVWLN